MVSPAFLYSLVDLDFFYKCNKNVLADTVKPAALNIYFDFDKNDAANRC